MSIEEYGDSVCDDCGGYSNSGFNLCEECAEEKFTKKGYNKALKDVINYLKSIDTIPLDDDVDNILIRIKNHIGLLNKKEVK